ncbi:isoleucyl-tRNA synthetase [Thermogladius calderae 1633]|uniref:Isoleucine--tRNA ligase n=1 Tax=Thermogladius calderae (strain DSM 22663 / VKM B-2946 / 1633) TaxID=1184251 RepID=I3TEQ2_THEC1|nr:isoleucine--tRNA ligase [Thermogladius calderae]AFK51240.1 isoleucyl-tRNA synthetase [Thermogladius calderae 1633]
MGYYLPIPGKLTGQYDWRIVEDAVKSYWAEVEIYRKMREKAQRSPNVFVFIDGPPYPSGDVPHIGTLWNKTLKDVVLRFKRMRGFRVFDKPGYDCHGLPIEVKVEQRLGLRSKREIEEKIGVDKFVEECRRLALTNAASMTKWFEEIGVAMDWESPYYTLDNKYIESAWWLIKRAHESGLLDKDYRVVHWCPRCQTTLAEYEVEYHDLESPSIVVKMPVEGEPKTFLLVWTTTPWTLPANTFIMVNPKGTYVRVGVGDEVWILAKPRLGEVMELAGVEDYSIIEEFPGEKLVGLKYKHPLEDLVEAQKKLSKYHVVLPSEEYVSLYEGTGLVHAAPGHGFEDFEVAKKSGIDLVVSPVNDEGVFTEEAGKYKGMFVRDANRAIIEDLRERGYLVYEGSIIHKYPVCWRCKTPVVLRATKQWVIRVSRLKDRLVQEAKSVKWIPEWALQRMLHMLENVQDWVVSRQRYWGTPLPVWVCENGHYVVVGGVDDIRRLGGEVPPDLHRPWIDRVELKCPVCGRSMRRVEDVVDVWLDSGIAFYAARGRPLDLKGGEVVVDFIVEGHDQTRGWFFSLLRSGVIGFGVSPYKTVLVHGFALDEKGREMHKSLGNYVGADEAINRAGRDPLRLWLLSNTVWEDLRFSWKSIEEVASDLQVAWNVYLFASTYMNLDKFEPSRNGLEKFVGKLKFEDKWLLSRFTRTLIRITESLENYRIHEAVREWRRFVVEDLSHWYLRIVRPRIWVEEETEDKLAAYAVLYYVLKNMLVVAAPFIPFFAEYVYQKVFRPVEGLESIHLSDWPQPDHSLLDDSVEKEMEVVRTLADRVAAARMKAGIKLRQPVKSVIVYTDKKEVAEVVEKHSELLKKVFNSKAVEVKDAKSVEEIVVYTLRPVYKKLGPKFKELAGRVIEYVKGRESEVAHGLLTKGYFDLEIEGRTVRLEQGDFEVVVGYVEGYAVEVSELGTIAVDKRLTEREVAEGLARDVVRRIQVMRKMMNLELDEKIETYIVAPADKKSLLAWYQDYVKNETGSVKVELVDTIPELDGYTREWDIGGDVFVIMVRRVGR